eukprot:g7975.t1
MSSSDDDSDDDNAQHNENSLILYNAAHDGELDKCIEAIKNGASPDYQKHNGYTPLHISAQEGHVEIVKYLIVKCRCNLDIQTNDHDTALVRAVRKGHTDVVQLLVENGASMTIKKKSGDTVVHLAVSWNYLHIVKIFVEHGAQLDVQNDHGDTPLHTAVEEGRREMVEILIGRGANMDLPTFTGETPLHYAAYEGKYAIAKLLIEKGCNYTLKNASGKTPLDEALEKDNQMVVEVLEEASATSFNAISLWRSEAKVLEKRIVQMQADHERALKVARNIHDRDVDQTKRTLKSKHKEEKSNRIKAHKEEFQAMEKKYKAKIDDSQLIIKHLKLEIQESKEIYLKEKKEWEEKLKYIEDEKEGVKQAEEEKFEDKLKNMQKVLEEESSKKIKSIETTAQKAIDRVNMLALALQEQNNSLSTKLKTAELQVTQNLHSKEAEVASKIYNYELEIGRLQQENTTLENRVNKLRAEHQEDKANWSAQKHFDLDKAVEEEERKREKVVYEVVQEKMKTLEVVKAEYEKKLQLEREKALKKGAVNHELRRRSFTQEKNEWEQQQSMAYIEEKRLLLTELNRLREENKSNKHTIAKNFFRHLLHNQLNHAWKIWMHHTTQLRRIDTLRSKLVIRWKAMHLVQVFDRWKEFLRRVKEDQRIIRNSLQKVINRTLSSCFATWSNKYYDRKFIKDMLKKYLHRKQYDESRSAFNQFVETIVTERKIERFKTKIVKRMMNITLSKMFSTWYHVFKDNKRNRHLIQQSILRLNHVHLSKCFITWKDKRAKRVYVHHLLHTIVYKKKERDLKCGFEAFRRNVAFINKRNSIVKHIFGKGNDHMLRRGWNSFIAWVKTSKQLEIVKAKENELYQYKLRIAKQTIRRLCMKTLYWALMSWKHYCTDLERLEAVKERIMRRWNMRIEASCFHTWEQNARLLREERNKLQHAIRRIKRIELFSGWSSWVEYVEKRKKARLTLDRLFNKEEHESYVLRLQKAWMTWERFTIENKFLDIEEARCKGEIEHRKRLMKHVVAKLRHKFLSHGFHHWQQIHAQELKNELLIKKVALRMKHLHAYHTFKTWHDFTTNSKHERHVIATVRNRIMNHTKHKAFSQWVHFIERRHHMRLMFINKAHSWREANLQKGFYTILQFGLAEAGQIEAMQARSQYNQMKQKNVRKTLLKMMRAKLHVAFVSWRNEANWIKRTETAKLRIIKRIKNLTLASTYHTWQKNARAIRENRVLLTRVVKRIKMIKLSKCFISWDHFVGRRRKARDTLRFVFGGKSREYTRRMLAHGFLRFQQNLTRKRIEESHIELERDNVQRETRVVRSVLSRLRSRKLGNAWRTWKHLVEDMRQDDFTHLHHQRIINNIIRKFKSKSLWRAFKQWHKVNFSAEKKSLQRINSHKLAKKIREATVELNELRAHHKEIMSEQKIEILSLRKELDNIHGLHAASTSKESLGELLLKCAHDTLYTHADIAKTVLELGAPVNYTNKFGNTALHLAAGSGHLDLVQVLCLHGADPEASDQNGNTPINKAQRHNNVEVATYLRAHKIKQLRVNKPISLSPRPLRRPPPVPLFNDDASINHTFYEDSKSNNSQDYDENKLMSISELSEEYNKKRNSYWKRYLQPV